MERATLQVQRDPHMPTERATSPENDRRAPTRAEKSASERSKDKRPQTARPGPQGESERPRRQHRRRSGRRDGTGIGNSGSQVRVRQPVLCAASEMRSAEARATVSMWGARAEWTVVGTQSVV